MAASDDLTKLAARAKTAEDHAAAAKRKAAADLHADVESARDAAEKDAAKLRSSADAKRQQLSDSWSDHVAKARADFARKRAEHDATRAKRNAEDAEDEATFAIDFAYAAIEQAEYAVLDAVLARKEADELAAV